MNKLQKVNILKKIIISLSSDEDISPIDTSIDERATFNVADNRSESSTGRPFHGSV